MGRRTSIYLREDTETQIKTRCGEGELSATITRDLERLYAMYELSLSRVNLTVSEACLIADSLNGTIFDARTASFLWAQIEDSINLDNLAGKWEIDAPTLVGKLKQLTLIESMAVIDAAERFWEEEPQDSIQERVKGIFRIKNQADKGGIVMSVPEFAIHCPHCGSEEVLALDRHHLECGDCDLIFDVTIHSGDPEG